MARASCSYSAPRRALSASVWPLGMDAGTQVGPPPPTPRLPFLAPQPWGLGKPLQCLLAAVVSASCLWLNNELWTQRASQRKDWNSPLKGVEMAGLLHCPSVHLEIRISEPSFHWRA